MHSVCILKRARLWLTNTSTTSISISFCHLSYLSPRRFAEARLHNILAQRDAHLGSQKRKKKQPRAFYHQDRSAPLGLRPVFDLDIYHPTEHIAKE